MINQINYFYRFQAILLVVNRMLLDYFVACRNCSGVEPEKFAESWIRMFILCDDSSFNEDIFKAFISELQKAGKKIK